MQYTEILLSEPSNERWSKWRTRFPPPNAYVQVSEKLPFGWKVPWFKWKALNSLRYQMSRSKQPMAIWGMDHGSTRCICETSQQTMAHLLKCPSFPHCCSRHDLIVATTGAINITLSHIGLQLFREPWYEKKKIVLNYVTNTRMRFVNLHTCAMISRPIPKVNKTNTPKDNGKYQSRRCYSSMVLRGLKMDDLHESVQTMMMVIYFTAVWFEAKIWLLPVWNMDSRFQIFIIGSFAEDKSTHHAKSSANVSSKYYYYYTHNL